ncbi:MAG: ABC transporter [Novosphingobium sp.]
MIIRKPTMRTPSRLMIAAPLIAALSGCLGLGGGKPPETLFNLAATAPVPSGVELNSRLDDAIMVLDPETDRRLAVSRVAVQVDASNVAYLKDAQWVEHPAHLFGALLAETIRSRGKRLVLSSEEALGNVRMRLGGRLIDMGYDARSQSAVVRFEAVRVGPGGATLSKRFEAVVPGVSPKAASVGPALNRAANDVAGQVADWVG